MPEGHFLTTQWSVVLAAGDSNSPEFPSALESLCRDYWFPLFAFIRKSGRSAADAKDLTQSFFERLIEERIHAGADPDRGRFRAYLLGALRRHLADEARWTTRKKRGGGKIHLDIDEAMAEARYARDLVAESSPEQTFDREWAILTIEAVVDRLKNEYRSSGQLDRFNALCAHLMRDGETSTYEEIGRQLGLKAEGVRTAAKKIRARFQSLFREHLLTLVASPALAEEELLHLIQAAGATDI